MIRIILLRDHKFYKIFNKTNVKDSYSCMSKIYLAISSYKRKILYPPVKNQSRTCTYINKTDCLLKEKYLNKSILYQADNNLKNRQKKNFYGILEKKINIMYVSHKKSFSHLKQNDDKNYSVKSRKLKRQRKKQL